MIAAREEKLILPFLILAMSVAAAQYIYFDTIPSLFYSALLVCASIAGASLLIVTAIREHAWAKHLEERLRLVEDSFGKWSSQDFPKPAFPVFFPAAQLSKVSAKQQTSGLPIAR